MTIGIAANTLLSTAIVVHVVQPRFDAPATKNFLILTLDVFSENSVTASYFCVQIYVIKYSYYIFLFNTLFNVCIKSNYRNFKSQYLISFPTKILAFLVK